MPAAAAPELVVLGALPAEEAAIAAGSIRARWTKAKIVLLFDRASAVDLQKLVASEIDGCIPLSASPDALTGTLKHIINTGHRIVVLQTAPSPKACSTEGREKSNQPAVTQNYVAPDRRREKRFYLL